MGPYEPSGAYAQWMRPGELGCLTFLVDRSQSMEGPFGGRVEGIDRPTKAHAVADVVNGALAQAVLCCLRSDTIVDRVHLSIIGNGTQVGPALGVPLRIGAWWPPQS
jgi:hypothetical protein